jgi:maleate isomerase
MTAVEHKPEYQRHPDVFDRGRHWRAKLGFVLLAMEQTIESDLFRMAPPGVGVHVTRAAMADAVTVETLRDMADGLQPAAEMLLPALRLDVVCYACTSGSIVIGEEAVAARLTEGSDARQVTTLVGGVVRGLRALQARRLSVLTPYVAGINDLELDYLRQQGFAIDTLIGLEIESDQDIARVRPEFLLDFAERIVHPSSDAVFISCGALRSVDIIDDLEARIGRPVVTSNQAMMWDCLRTAGIDDHLNGFGRLFRGH